MNPDVKTRRRNARGEYPATGIPLSDPAGDLPVATRKPPEGSAIVATPAPEPAASSPPRLPDAPPRRIEGDMDVLGLVGLLPILLSHQRVGTLTVHDADSRRIIHLSPDGLLMISTGKRKGPRLGEMLVATKRLTFAQVTRALQYHKTEGLPFGEAAVRLGYISHEDLFRAIFEQIEEELCDLFLWTGAAFDFVEEPPSAVFSEPGQPVAVLRTDLQALTLEAMRRADEWRQYDGYLGGGRAVYALTDRLDALAEAYAIDPVFAIVTQCVDGRRAVDEVVNESGLSRFLVYTILARLLQDGCLKRIGSQTVR